MCEEVKNDEISENKSEKTCILKNSKCMKYVLWVILAVAAAGLLSFKYSLVSTENNVYRINRITGDVQLIKGSRFVDIDKIGKSGVSQIKTMEEVALPQKDIKCNLEILWRNDNLYYTFSASPYSGELKKLREGSYFDSINKGFDIELYDENKFVIAHIPVKINEMTGVVDESGKPSELLKKGKINLSYEDMKLVKDWSTTWNF